MIFMVGTFFGYNYSILFRDLMLTSKRALPNQRVNDVSFWDILHCLWVKKGNEGGKTFLIFISDF